MGEGVDYCKVTEDHKGGYTILWICQLGADYRKNKLVDFCSLVGGAGVYLIGQAYTHH